jgi:hypothetical protein
MNALDAEGYCASVNSTLPLVSSVNDVTFLGKLLEESNITSAFVANNIRYGG